MDKTIKKRILVVTGAIILLISLVVGLFFVFGGGNDKVKVTFNTSGGSTIASQVIKKGTMVKRPAKPIRRGYIFDDWYLKSKRFDFNTKVDADITLVAKWLVDQEYDDEEEEETLDEPAATEEIGDSATTITTPTKPTKPASKPIYYQVAFNPNGGSAVANQSIRSGSVATKPANPSRAYHNFVGWFFNGSPWNFSTPITKAITLTAHWEKTYTYRISVQNVDNFSPQRKVYVTENGAAIGAKAVLNSAGVVLGKYNDKAGAILVDKSEVSGIAKIRLNNDSIVNVTK